MRHLFSARCLRQPKRERGSDLHKTPRLSVVLQRLDVVILLAVAQLTAWPGTAVAQQHHHGGGETTIERPKIFLDKSPRIVAYQLKRLDNQRLLMVERKSDDAKFVPVYSAILARVGMSPQYREEAVEALVKLGDSDPVTVLLEAVAGLDPEQQEQRRTSRQLSGIMLRLSADVLQQHVEQLADATESDNPAMRWAGFAGMVVAGETEAALTRAGRDEPSTLDWLSSVSLIPSGAQRAELGPSIVDAVKQTGSAAIRRAAVQAISFVPGDEEETFRLIAPLVADAGLRMAAVRTLLKIPNSRRDASATAALVVELVEYAEKTPAKDRTSDAFVDAMQLADQLLAKIPTEDARSYRTRLSAVSVRVVRIRTVEEEMRYDLPYFAVEAGRPVQVILENHDLMPHNLVITVPGALKEVAQLGLQAGPSGGWNGLQYVPESDKVLHATQMVPSDAQTRLTFDAPTEPGEYPYVCTFPQHWYRMYGVMVVVEDLDTWLKDPVEPANPIGSNRSFVRSWKVEDLRGELDSGLRGRTAQIGKKLFEEASCAGCHKVQGQGGEIGPELTDLYTRWKGDRVSVLREVLDPSHKVDAKYAMQRVLTFDGRTITGILVSEDDDNVKLVASAEAKEPIVIAQDDIDAMVPSAVSMMPKALLDQYTQDEIFEILSYLQGVDPAGSGSAAASGK
jgi:putative heme-binding domain-containing protein